jgi:hypothetical protein
MNDTLTSTEVCRVAGITYRQLDAWTRAGILTSSVQSAEGSGSRRRFSRHDALVATAIGLLVAEGVAPSALVALVDELTGADSFTGLVFVTRGRVSRSLPYESVFWCVDLDRVAIEVDVQLSISA